jgi:diguanylate cyclase (GGDEF)-like protein
MKRDLEDLGHEVERLLADPRYQGHPLHSALALLWDLHREHTSRLERVTVISDGFQSMVKRRERELDKTLERQARRLEKVARISDSYQRMMQDTNHELTDASNHDVLTSLPNRRHLMQRLQLESERCRAHEKPFTVGLLDVDHFKLVNDTLGHAAGDEVLIEIGRLLRGSMRAGDICGRWGGEEFLLILPGTTADEAHTLVLRVCREMSIQVQPMGITASVGISSYHGHESWADTVNRADAALLEAKRRGRNCIVLASSPQEDDPRST